MRARRNASFAASALLRAVAKLLFLATCCVSACNSPDVGVGKLCSPALISCKLYWLVPRHCSCFSRVMPWHSPRFGPVGDFPLTTYASFPSALKLIEFGYQPVGIKPTTRLCFGVELS